VNPKSLLTLLCTFAIPAVGPAAEYGKVTMSKVADDVYLFSTSPYGDVGFGGNAVAILTNEGVVMFDTGATPAAGDTILAELRKLTDKPVLYVINSHWHWDHWGGNQSFRAAFPYVQFLSHAKNRELMRDVAIPWNAPGLEKDLPGYIAYQKEQLAAAEAKNSPAEALAKRRELLAADEEFLRQKRSVEYTFPNSTFSGSATLYLGGREIRVLHDRAITPGDTYLYLPKEKILITGDILVHPIPFAVGGSYPQDWIRTLEKLDSLDVSLIIPGHGEAEHDKVYLTRNLELFRHVKSDVVESRAKGRTAEQTRTDLTAHAAAYAAHLGIAEARLTEFQNYFLNSFIDRAYRELENPSGDSPK